MRKIFNNFVPTVLNSVPVGADYIAFSDFQKMLDKTDTRFSCKIGKENFDLNLNGGKFRGTVRLSKGQYLDLDFGKTVCFDTVSLWEKGDNCLAFKISALTGGEWETVYRQDRILSFHTCYLGNISAQKLRIEILDCKTKVALRGIYVYQSKKSNGEFRVSQYLRLDQQNFDELVNDEGFLGYYDVVTDVILFEEAFINENAEIAFHHSEQLFASQLEALQRIIGERNVKIRCCLFFDQKDKNGKRNFEYTKNFINSNIDKITKNIQAFTGKYNLYGIDYDWEFPRTLSQWKSYELITERTSEITKVSVALPPWGIMFGEKTIKSIEFVNLMAYDLFDKAGDHSNSFICGYNAIRKLLNAGFKKEQILLGIPTYGRTVDRSEYAWPTVRDDGKELGLWNNTIQFEYKDLETNEIRTSKAYLNSYAQVRDKTALSLVSGIGGVMIFRAFCDAPYTCSHCLHRAINEVIFNNKKKP